MIDNENLNSEQPQQNQPTNEDQPKFDDILEQAQTQEPPIDSFVNQSLTEEPLPQDVINMVVLSHLLGLIGYLAPLLIWLLKKDEHEFINEQVKGILNYQISMMIYFIAGWLLCIVRVGVIVLPILAVVHIVFIIIASVKTSESKPYHYPIAINFLK